MASYGLKYNTMMIIKEKEVQISNPNFWNDLLRLNSSDEESKKKYFEIFYWLNSGNLIFKLFSKLVLKYKPDFAKIVNLKIVFIGNRLIRLIYLRVYLHLVM